MTMIPPHTKAVIMSVTRSQLIFMTPDKRHREAPRAERPSKERL